jgi:hypothetical protein
MCRLTGLSSMVTEIAVEEKYQQIVVNNVNYCRIYHLAISLTYIYCFLRSINRYLHLKSVSVVGIV